MKKLFTTKASLLLIFATVFAAGAFGVSFMRADAMCTVDTEPPCGSLTPVDGVCAATHYNCSVGASANNVQNATTWTWSCLGAKGGLTANCSENIPQPPTNSISASATTVSYNGTATISWSSSGATSCTVTQNSVAWKTGTSGSSVTPAITSANRYGVTCTNAAGTSAEAVIWVTAMPYIASFYASANPVSYGGAATLTWTSYNATVCALTVGSTVYSNALSGSISTGAITGSTLFWLSCSNGVGNVNSSVTMNSIPGTPTIAASANPVAYGGSATISWSSSNATACSVTKAGAAWSSGTSGSANSGALTAATTFSITCTNAYGTSPAASVTVGVLPGTPSISVTPNPVAYGAATTVSWSSANATACTVTKGGVSWQSGTSGSVSSGALTAATTFSVTCTNAYGTSAASAVTVGVVPGTPSISASANPVAYGGSATISWSSTNATACSVTKAGAAWSSGTSGSANSGALTAATTFAITCTNAYGTGPSNSVTVGVLPGTPSIGAAANPVAYNAATNISWSSSNATACSVTKAGAAWSSGTSNAGLSSGALTAATTFAITCSNGYGTGPANSVTVGVLPATPSIAAAANPVAYNTATNISWSSTNATACSVTKAGAAWSSGTSNAGLSSGALTAATTFAVTCTNGYGTSPAASVTVGVLPAQPSISASTNPVLYNGTSNITWSSTYATACSVTKAGVSFSTALSGSAVSSGALTADTTFAISCSNGYGTAPSNSVTVQVRPAVTVTTNPTAVSCNAASTISWTSSYASSCSVTKAGAAWQTGTSNAGVSSGVLSSATSFVGTCTGANGLTQTDTKTVTVSALNGACGATHYTCTSGTTANNVAGTASYTWNCNGACGGSSPSCTELYPPNAPTISGPTPATLGIGMDGTFSISGTDPSGMQVQYAIDWDNNGTVDGTTALGASGWTYSAVNNWGGAGSKTFQVRTVASDGRTSAWTSKTLTIIGPAVPTISAATTPVNYGAATNITWGSSNASSCSVTEAGAAWQTGLSGTVSSGALTADTTFVNTCLNAAGQSASASVTVQVRPAVTVTTNPTAVSCNAASTISWTSSYASSCSVTKAGSAWQTGTSNAGVSSGALSSATSFVGTCTAANGLTQTDTKTVTVSALNGACGATHYTCTSGTTANNAAGTASYTWNCNGACGGTNATCEELYPPQPPTITGPTSGAISTDYTFNMTGTDPSGMQVQYAIDWDNNGTVDGTTALGASGWNYAWVNNWGGTGTKYFKARTVASDGRTSAWSATYAFTVVPAAQPTISASPTTVDYNSASTITWSSTDATTCSVTKAGAAWQTGTSNAGVTSGNLVADTVFGITCSGTGGSNSTSITVKVRPQVTLTGTPTSIAYASSSMMSWTSSYAASCSVTKAGAAWQTGTSNAGVSSGALLANTTFVATCTSSSGTTQTSTQTITVAPLNGSCGTTPAHYICAAGTSVSNLSGPLQWTWTCNGANGGTNAGCSETKPAPLAPTIGGPTQGQASTTYAFTFKSTNPSGDDIRYAIDWDNNGTVDQYLPASGTTTQGTQLTAYNSWGGSGFKYFKARAEVIGGPVSGWTSAQIQIFAPPTVTLTSNMTIAYNATASFGFTSTDATTCSYYDVNLTTGTTSEITLTPLHATSSTWTDVGPYQKDFKRRVVCQDPFSRSDTKDMTVTVLQNDATCGAITPPSYVARSEVFTATSTMYNAGTNPWTTTFLANYFLWSSSTTWTIDSVSPTVATVNSGTTGTFVSSSFTAPNTQGDYDFIWQMRPKFSGNWANPFGSTCPAATALGTKVRVKDPLLVVGNSSSYSLVTTMVSDPTVGYTFAQTVAGDPANTTYMRVRNLGGGTISNVNVSVDPASPSTGTFAYTGPAGFTLGPGEIKDVPLTFAASATGTYASIAHVSATGQTTVNVPLSGTAIEKLVLNTDPAALTSLSTLDFGDAATSRFKFLNFTIKNQSLTQSGGSVSTSTASNPVFTCVYNCTFDLPPGSSSTPTSVNIKFKFAPMATGTEVGTYTFMTNPPITITLTGVGVKPVYSTQEK